MFYADFVYKNQWIGIAIKVSKSQCLKNLTVAKDNIVHKL